MYVRENVFYNFAAEISLVLSVLLFTFNASYHQVECIRYILHLLIHEVRGLDSIGGCRTSVGTGTDGLRSLLKLTSLDTTQGSCIQ